MQKERHYRDTTNMSGVVNHVLLGVLVVLCVSCTLTEGHGRLIDPPARSSMWRYGFDNPPCYDDNQLFCGGFERQWTQNGGKCGICGDPWDGVREHEAGGPYANGIIVRQYAVGSSISVTVELTANHKGWFEFRICAVNDYKVEATSECLDRGLLAQTANGQTRYTLPSDSAGLYTVQLRLPTGLTCSQCVVQWKYHSANSWGTDPDGSSCVGCGPQEEFYGCADVEIK